MEKVPLLLAAEPHQNNILRFSIHGLFLPRDTLVMQLQNGNARRSKRCHFVSKCRRNLDEMYRYWTSGRPEKSSFTTP